MKAALAWIWKNLVAILTALVAILGAGLFWSYHRGKIRSLETENALEVARAKVAALDARRAALAERAEENAEAIRQIETKREKVRREAVALERSVENLSGEELARAFRDLY